MASYPYRIRCTKCNKEFIYKSEHAMIERRLYDKIVATALCPSCKEKTKGEVNAKTV